VFEPPYIGHVMKQKRAPLLIRIYCCLLWIGVFAGTPVTGFAAGQVHLLGFVENICADESYCFELRVEAEYIAIAGSRITVRFKQVTTIFDPENYELTLEQSNIIPGSHLRLLLTPDSDGVERNYRANYIWIGD
jgi:hypothetical protein